MEDYLVDTHLSTDLKTREVLLGELKSQKKDKNSVSIKAGNVFFSLPVDSRAKLIEKLSKPK